LCNSYNRSLPQQLITNKNMGEHKIIQHACVEVLVGAHKSTTVLLTINACLRSNSTPFAGTRKYFYCSVNAIMDNGVSAIKLRNGYKKISSECFSSDSAI
jgi:hypothetical protein